MRRFAVLGLIGAFLVLAIFPETVKACSCAPRQSPAEALQDADAVFRGQVSKIGRVRSVQGYERVEVTLAVAEVWKGEVGREVIINTGSGGGDCGFGFISGVEYLVYAYAFADAANGIDYGLSTGICTRTKQIAGAGGDLVDLGPGRPPSDNPQPTLPPQYRYSPQCFPQTGKYIDDLLFYYWKEFGGLELNGYPISEARTETLEDGKRYWVQWFERTRLEMSEDRSSVTIGHFGRRIHPPDPPVAQLPGATYFPETGHNVTRPEFVAYWQANGGLLQFGYPLSEEITETLEDGNEYRVQYFERSRFEWHPENPDPYRVLLGQFGRRILAEQPAPLPSPEPTPGQRILRGHGDCVTDVAFSRDGGTVASVGYDRTIRLWDVPSGTERRILTGHLDRINLVALSADGRFLASASDDCTLRIWNPATGALLHTLYPHSCRIASMAFSPYSRYLATGGNRQIILWDPASGQEIRRFSGEPDAAFLTFSPDGRTLVGGTYFRQIILYDVATGQPRPLPWQELYAISAVFTPDGQQLISGSRPGGVVTIWDINSGQVVRVLNLSNCGVGLLAISPDGQTLFTGGYQRICSWDFATATLRQVLYGHENSIGGFQLSADGRWLASAGFDTTVRLWPIEP